MSTNCCHKFTSGDDNSKDNELLINDLPKQRTWTRRLIDTIKCAVPGAVLVLLPKCPICMAAWISVGTGLGISVSVAGWVRIGLIIFCISSLSYFVISRIFVKLRKGTSDLF